MYQFKYSPFGFAQPEEWIITCIVPTNWLSLDLPTMNGVVNYSDKLGNLVSCESNDELNYYSDFLGKLVSCESVVFDFCERSSSDKMWRAFSLDILRDGGKHFDTPIVIHVPRSMQSEVLLLNHLFGFCAESSFVGLCFADFLALLKESSTYYLEYGVGKSPADILPNILQSARDGDVKCGFITIFVDDFQEFRLESLDEAWAAMSSGSSDESMWLIGAAVVEQDEMLISVLVGR